MDNYLPTFRSFPDFLRRFTAVFRGPFLFSTFRKTEPLFREKLLLVVSMANNCAG